MNVKSLITANYENWTLGHIGQTNPIQTQFSEKAKMNVSAANTMNYEQRTMNCLAKTNPIQTQFCPPPAKQDRTTCRVVAPCEDGSNHFSRRSPRRSRVKTQRNAGLADATWYYVNQEPNYVVVKPWEMSGLAIWSENRKRN